MVEQQNGIDAYAALRVPAFRWFLSMRMMTTLAIQIMSVAVQYFVYELTSNPLMLGLIGLAEAIPAIAISLYAGHIADKSNRRNILAGCISLLLLCAFALSWFAHMRDVWPKETVLTGVYVVIFCTGITRGFFSPTYFSFMPQLVDRKILPNAISWNSSTWEIASISGLGLGGLLYGWGHGPETAFNVMTVLLVIGLFFVLNIAPRPVPPADLTEPALTRIKEGLNFTFGNKLLIGSMAIDLLAVLFGGAVAMLPVYAKDILKVGPEGLGALRAAMSIGAISMAFVIAHRPIRQNAGKLMLGCIAGFGGCIIGFGLSTHFWLSFFFLFLAGVFDEVSVFIRASLIQHLTPEHMKGRVSAVTTIFITSSNEIGAFESGLAASLLGTVPSVLFGGITTLVVAAIAWAKAPTLRDLNFEDIHSPTS